MSTILTHRLRFKCDPAKKLELKDLISTQSPTIARSKALTVEWALYFNDVIQSVANLTTVTFELKSVTDLRGAALMYQEITSFDDTTDNSTFTAGTKQHGTFSFTELEVAPPMAGKYAKEFWFTIWATTNTGAKFVLAAQKVTLIETGGNTVSPDVPEVPTGIRTVTGSSYTLVLSDSGRMLTFSSGSAINLIVPSNSSVPFLYGTNVSFVPLGSGGQITVVSGSGGVVINSADSSNKTRVRYSPGNLQKTGEDVWLLVGDLTS